MSTRQVLIRTLWFAAALGVLAPSLASAQVGPSIVAKDGEIVASNGNVITWRHVVEPNEKAGAERRKSKGKKPKKEANPSLRGPVQLDGRVYYAWKAQLYETDARSGIVQHRALLPGRVDSLAAKDGKLVVQVSGERSSTEKNWKKTMTFQPGKLIVPFQPGDSFISTLLIRKQANVMSAPVEARINTTLTKNKKTPGDARFEDRMEAARESQAQLAELLPKLEAAARQDPTNIMFLARKAEYQALLGRRADAEETMRRIIHDVPEANSPELLMVVNLFDSINPELADAAFSRGLGAWIRQGYEPELQRTLINYAVMIGKPAPFDLTRPDEAARLERFARRVHAFAPHMEASSHFFHTVSELYASAGNGEQAALWAQRAKEAQPFEMIGADSADVAWALNGLNYMFGAVLALWLLFLVKIGRTLPLSFDREVPPLILGNPFSRWTRGEVGGMVLLGGVLVYLGARVSTGIKVIGIVAAAPIALLSGTVGHPTAQHYMQHSMQQTEEVIFLSAVGLDQAGDLKGAEALYTRIKDNRKLKARAQNNLGGLAARRGDAAAASKHYKEALKLDSGLAEANHNAGNRLAATSRIKMMQTYNPDAPVRALLPTKQWTAFWRAAARGNEHRSPGFFGALRDTVRKITAPVDVLRLADTVDGPGSVPPVGIATGGALCLALLSLIALFGPGTEAKLVPSRLGWPAWIGGWLLPGGSRQWGVLGGVLAAAFFGSLIGAMTLMKSDGLSTNILSAIAIPAFGKFFGLTDMQYAISESEQIARTFAQLFWVYIVLNMIFLPLAEWVAPDPSGPFGEYFAKKDAEER